MTSLQDIGTKSTVPTMESRKRWMGYALALSLVLHIVAALVFIFAGSLRMGERNNLNIQEIELTPSISAPVKTAPARTDPRAAMTAAKPPPPMEADKPAQEQSDKTPPTSTDSPEKENALVSTPLGLGMTHGYFSGLADGRSLRDDIRGYYFEMVGKINREWWDKAGLLKEPLQQDGIFELVIQRDGTIISTRIIQGTGSRDADRLLTEIIRSTSSLPSLPSTYGLELFRAPLRIKAPSFLFRLKN